jgi:hypothetical protein
MIQYHRMSVEHHSPEKRPEISPNKQEWVDLSADMRAKYTPTLIINGYTPVEALSFGIIDKELQDRYKRELTMYLPNLVSYQGTHVEYPSLNGTVRKPAIHCMEGVADLPNREDKAFILVFAGHLFADKAKYEGTLQVILGQTNEGLERFPKVNPIIPYKKITARPMV